MFLLVSCLLGGSARAGLKELPGHRPAVVAKLASNGQVAGSRQLHLALGVPLRDAAGLTRFLAQLYTPGSSNFHRYLTPKEFAERFGPAEEDYRKVSEFAATHGLKVVATSPNRLLLDVTGPVTNIENAFQVKLRTYPHPTEKRSFYAPDANPRVDERLPIADVSGLSDFQRPRPRSLRQRSALKGLLGARGSGSAPGGGFLGNDFRAAYLPGVVLQGAGQKVGLVEFEAYYGADIEAYRQAAGLPAVPLETVLLDDIDYGLPVPGSEDNAEPALDVELVMAMAPALSAIVVFNAGPYGMPNDVLNAMACSNDIKQLSCSWGWPGGPSATTDAIFQQMAAQGQSFFNASGDSDAFTSGSDSANGVDNVSLQNAPSSSPYITMVGGTTLTTTGPQGAWVSERVWNWGEQSDGSSVGSSGGISSYYTIPDWQTNVNMSANGGSSSYRNIPDVALTADNVYVTYNNGSAGVFGGTSCAAPLWAAMTALINEQAQDSGLAPVGFLNPRLYSLGTGPAFSSLFHDITSGNNASAESPSQFYATGGYDLCTGWGTPSGQPLVNTLAAMTNQVFLLPASDYSFIGPVGGPFDGGSRICQITNLGNAALTWSLVNTSAWLHASVSSGVLAAHAATQVTLSLDGAVDSLPPQVLATTLLLTNSAHSSGSTRVSLCIGQSLVRNGGFEAGDWTDWSVDGDLFVEIGGFYYFADAVFPADPTNAPVHSGEYGAFLGDTQLASVFQTVPTVPGQYYLLSFWLLNMNGGSGEQFQVNWQTNGSGSASLFSLNQPDAFGWTNLQFLVQATSTNSTIEFEAENDNSFFALDEVSLLAVPSPEFVRWSRQPNSVSLGWNASTGLVYQVQYRTNLLQGAWQNLGSALSSTGFSATLLDTNVSSASRFYRLGLGL